MYSWKDFNSRSAHRETLPTQDYINTEEMQIYLE
jgi:hypothetical protein